MNDDDFVEPFDLLETLGIQVCVDEAAQLKWVDPVPVRIPCVSVGRLSGGEYSSQETPAEVIFSWRHDHAVIGFMGHDGFVMPAQSECRGRLLRWVRSGNRSVTTNSTRYSAPAD
ncbi:hypothetical protein QTH97_26050 [Variovorax sp. J22R24]|uniref:hypothetical protein n=1 Tax=Variovorax gracilis TaxID=3053502 RepID=UPI002575841A|nr:hypothetical protein [Variovorax sp. J22R24]MDM0108438.1 hypothetical protein [Variovorax sp. J22R24]